MNYLEALRKRVEGLLTPYEIKVARALLESQEKDPSDEDAVRDVSNLMVAAAWAAVDRPPGTEVIIQTITEAAIHRIRQARDKPSQGSDTIDS